MLVIDNVCRKAAMDRSAPIAIFENWLQFRVSYLHLGVIAAAALLWYPPIETKVLDIA